MKGLDFEAQHAKVRAIYTDYNRAGRPDASIDGLSFFLCLIIRAHVHRSKGCKPRETERLRRLRPQLEALSSKMPIKEQYRILQKFMDCYDSIDGFQSEIDPLRGILPITEIIERACQDKPLPHQEKPVTKSAAIAAIDRVVQRIGRRGRRRSIPTWTITLRDDYLWLTGKVKPDWTYSDLNAGLSGGFITFQCEILSVFGIDAKSFKVLRPISVKKFPPRPRA